MSNNLTEEQLRRCEENRKRALEIRASKSQQGSKVHVASATAINNGNNLSQKTLVIEEHRDNFYSSHPTTNSYFEKPVNTDAPVCISTTTANHLKTSNLNSNGHRLVGSCTLKSRNRFQIEMEYHNESVETFKKIPSRSYDLMEKRWSFDIKDHDRLISDLKKIQSVVIGGLPKNVIDIFKNAPKDKPIQEANISHLDKTLVEALMPFQKVGVSFGIMNNGRIIIADDMGLGKTIQAIAISAYYISEWPLLVVAPSSVRYSWEEAFHTWLPSLLKTEINIINSQKDILQNGKVLIMSYDMLSRMEKDIMKMNFRVVILDESHFLKNFKSARTKAAQNVVKQSSRVLLLTGTPALSRPVELYTQICLVNPKLFPSYASFGLRYCNGKLMPWGWDYTGSSNMTELHLILEETLLIRRLKSEIITDLPAKQRQMVLLDPSCTGGNRKDFQAWSEEMLTSGKHELLLKFFHSTGIAKTPAICKYIGESLKENAKFICFAHHQSVLDAICCLLKEKGCAYIRIDGSTSAENRKLNCDKFQFNDQCRVAVLSITAANAGITLTAAKLVIFAELYWNPGILTQAEDRVHRIGQQDRVIIQYLVAPGTADDHIWNLVQKKLDTLSKAGLSKDNFRDADTVCTLAPNAEVQKTMDYFFEKHDDECFWNDVLCDNSCELGVKKCKV